MNLPLTKCRNCECGFQGEAGDHEMELCNSCCIKVAKRSLERLTAPGFPEGFPENYKHHEKRFQESYLNHMAILKAILQLQ